MNAFLGEIRAFPYNFVPEGWLPCEGTEVPISMYSALYSIIGNYYGSPSNRDYFKLPNLQGRVLAGCSSGDDDFANVGLTAGASMVTLNQVSQIPVHTHSIQGFTHNPSTQNNLITKTPSATTLLTNATTKPATATPAAQKCYANTNTAPVQLNPNSLLPIGQNIGHENRLPYLTCRWGICIDGEFPSRP